MSPLKQAVVDLVTRMPDDCSIEDIQYSLYVQDRIRQGHHAYANGQTLDVDEVEKRVDQWPSSSGPCPQ